MKIDTETAENLQQLTVTREHAREFIDGQELPGLIDALDEAQGLVPDNGTQYVLITITR